VHSGIPPGDQAEAIVLDFVQPARPGSGLSARVGMQGSKVMVRNKPRKYASFVRESICRRGTTKRLRRMFVTRAGTADIER
jgi:hypothetical protein